MAAKKTTQKAADTQDPKQGEDPKQQELGQSGQPSSSEPENGPEQQPESNPDQGDQPTDTQDPEQQSSLDDEDSDELDPGADQDVFVLVDYNPLGLKCATVATISAGEARRLQARGIVDTAEEAVARGKRAQSASGRSDQVIEDDD